MRRTVLAMIGAVATSAICGLVQASTLTITNPGFDATLQNGFTWSSGDFRNGTYAAGSTLPVGFYVNASQSDAVQDTSVGNPAGDKGLVAGYTRSGVNAGIVNFQAGQVGTDPTGCIALFITNGTGATSTFSQTLPGSISLLPNATYILTFDVYKRIVLGLTTLNADLTVGGTALGGTWTYVAPTNSTEGSGTVTFQTGDSVASGNLGFKIWATGPNSSTDEIFVDNAAMTVNTVPEPSTLILLGSGLLGLLCYAWRKRK